MNASSCPPCANCGAALKGDWCHACGQKRIADEERRLSWLLREFVARVTSLDGKLVRSLLALVFRPGRLGTDWLEGRRVRWMSPMGLFLVVNLLHFLAPPVSDFNLSLYDHLSAQPYSGVAVSALDARVPGAADWVERGNGSEPPPPGYLDYGERFERRSSNLSRTILVTQVPLVALALLLLHWKRRIYFVDHFAIALHIWTLVLLAPMAVEVSAALGRLTGLDWLPGGKEGEGEWKLVLLSLLFSALVLMLRRAYRQPVVASIGKSLLVLVACVVSHLLYRGVLFTLTHYSI